MVDMLIFIAGRQGGREEGREALCENYNIAIGCPCSVQPAL